MCAISMRGTRSRCTHSPFDGVDFLTYPVIALIAVPIYLLVFALCDLLIKKRKKAVEKEENIGKIC